MRGVSDHLATNLLPFGIVSEPCLKFQALAADYHILTDLGFQQLTSLFDLNYLRKLRHFTANCATAALPGNIKLFRKRFYVPCKKQKCFLNILCLYSSKCPDYVNRFENWLKIKLKYDFYSLFEPILLKY